MNIRNIYSKVIRKTYHWQHFSNYKLKTHTLILMIHNLCNITRLKRITSLVKVIKISHDFSQTLTGSYYFVEFIFPDFSRQNE